jgi:predicted nucleic acid-binding Zn ribbon protein
LNAARNGFEAAAKWKRHGISGGVVFSGIFKRRAMRKSGKKQESEKGESRRGFSAQIG